MFHYLWLLYYFRGGANGNNTAQGQYERCNVSIGAFGRALPIIMLMGLFFHLIDQNFLAFHKEITNFIRKFHPVKEFWNSMPMSNKKPSIHITTSIPHNIKNWQKKFSALGGHLKMVRLPLLQGRHLKFLAGFLHFSSLPTLRPSDTGITRIWNPPLALPWADSSFL